MVKVILNIDKKYFFGLLFFGLMLVGIAGVVAYNAAGTGGNPAAIGHSVDEIDWTKAISGNVSAGGFCTSNGCITSIAGNGITITSANGTGNVTINAGGGIDMITWNQLSSDPGTRFRDIDEFTSLDKASSPSQSGTFRTGAGNYYGIAGPSSTIRMIYDNAIWDSSGGVLDIQISPSDESYIYGIKDDLPTPARIYRANKPGFSFKAGLRNFF